MAPGRVPGGDVDGGGGDDAPGGGRVNPATIAIASCLVLIPGLGATVAAYPPGRVGPVTRLALMFGLGYAVVGITAVVLVIVHGLQPATFFPLLAVVTVGLWGLSRLESRWVDGSSVAVVLVLLFAATVPLDAVQQIIARRNSSDWWIEKRNVRQRLYQVSGDDLVFVRYDPSHNFHHEWVYNGADIDHQPIVWAREIDAASDERLRNYFDKRHAWVVFADETPARLVEWSGRSLAVEPSDRPMVP